MAGSAPKDRGPASGKRLANYRSLRLIPDGRVRPKDRGPTSGMGLAMAENEEPRLAAEVLPL